MTSSMTVQQPVDQAEALRRGFAAEAREQISLDVSALSADTRALLAVRWRQSQQSGRVTYEPTIVGRAAAGPLRLPEPTAAALLAAVQADEEARAEQERKRADRIEAAVAKILCATDEELIGVWSEYAAGPAMHWLGVPTAAEDEAVRKDPGVAARIRWLREQRAAEAAAKREAAEAQRAKAEAREIIERQEAVTERAAWIAEHGSERLRRLVAEDIEHDAVYRSERLATERPGWRYDEALPGQWDEPRNPPVEALDLLDEARQTAPDATLVYWIVEPGVESDDDEEPEVVRGYTCRARLLGRAIVYHVADDGTPPVVA